MRMPAKFSNGRGLRAGLSQRDGAPARSCDATRRRRGMMFIVPSPWRLCAMGTNHIACYGVWRQGTRRMAERRNRTGETRWHKPYRGGVVLALPLRDAVNED